jgi:hypothetical protein
MNVFIIRLYLILRGIYDIGSLAFIFYLALLGGLTQNFKTFFISLIIFTLYAIFSTVNIYIGTRFDKTSKKHPRFIFYYLLIYLIVAFFGSNSFADFYMFAFNFLFSFYIIFYIYFRIIKKDK